MEMDIAKKGLKVAAVALIAAAVVQLATMNLGHNEIYRLGYSYGDTLRSTDEDEEPMDLKDLDAALGELEDQFGESSEASKLFDSEGFTEGVTNGYYKPGR